MHLPLKFPALFLILAAASARAELTWRETHLELKMKDGTSRVHDFYHFTNTGDKPLKLTAIPYCNCTAAEADKESYAPGEKGEIRLHFDPKGLPGGLVNKAIAIVTDDGSVTATLTFSVIIPQLAEVSPVSFSWSAEEAPQPKSFTVTFPAGTDYQVTRVESSIPLFTAKAEAMEPGHLWKITVTPPEKDKAKAGMVTQLSIHTDKEWIEGHKPIIIYASAGITPEPPLLGAEEFQKRLVAKSAVLVDARSADAYSRGHLPGAVSLPQESFAKDFPVAVPQLKSTGQELIAYGPEAQTVARTLQSCGYRNVSVFQGDPAAGK